MKKYNLPVIILNEIILFPYNTLKLEFDSKNIDNNIIEIANSFHNGSILITNPNQKIGILSKITNILELPNGNTRVDILGQRRVEIIEFLNLNKNEPLESIVGELESEIIENENIIVKKLIKEIKEYINLIPYVSNSILSKIETENSLDKITDLAIPNLIELERQKKYLNIINPLKRTEMLLTDIYELKQIFNIEKTIDLKVKKELDDTQKQYILKQKIKVIKEELGEFSNELDLYKNKISNLNCDYFVKEKLNIELNRYITSNNMSLESNLIRDYIDYILSLPWGNYTQDNEDLKQVKQILDESHFGLKEVKDRILEYLAVRKISNNVNGSIICLVGPPGVGKTSLAFSIAKALNKKFVKISVAGLNDEAEIIGHRKTYVGAKPGRIIDSLKNIKSNNPVFLIDEVDKIISNSKADPTSCLLSILDKEQNKSFSDNYIEVEYDLSNVFFILTANYIDNIPIALRDRLEIINITSYTEEEKLNIAKNYLLPKILNDNGLKKQFIDINDKIIKKIIRNYTKEAGIRELERQLNKLVRKIIAHLVISDIKINIINVTEELIKKYLGNEKYRIKRCNNKQVGIVNALAYTNFGGDILPIEVNYFKGNGKLILTGNLGMIMQESATLALNYLKSNYKYYKINYNLLFENDIHIHVPESAIKKDGPSAGLALALAILSALTKIKIPYYLGFTGELTLRGNILEIGGLKEKSIGALRNGIKTIIIPESNDINEIPSEIKNNLKIIKVNNFKQIYDFISKKNYE